MLGPESSSCLTSEKLSGKWWNFWTGLHHPDFVWINLTEFTNLVIKLYSMKEPVKNKRGKAQPKNVPLVSYDVIRGWDSILRIFGSIGWRESGFCGWRKLFWCNPHYKYERSVRRCHSSFSAHTHVFVALLLFLFLCMLKVLSPKLRNKLRKDSLMSQELSFVKSLSLARKIHW